MPNSEAVTGLEPSAARTTSLRGARIGMMSMDWMRTGFPLALPYVALWKLTIASPTVAAAASRKVYPRSAVARAGLSV